MPAANRTMSDPTTGSGSGQLYDVNEVRCACLQRRSCSRGGWQARGGGPLHLGHRVCNASKQASKQGVAAPCTWGIASATHARKQGVAADTAPLDRPPAPHPAPPDVVPNPQLDVYDFFNYYPSLALAIAALCLFALAAAAVGWLTERRRRYRFLHTMTATGLLEAGGYAALIYCIEQSGKGSIFTACE